MKNTLLVLSMYRPQKIHLPGLVYCTVVHVVDLSQKIKSNIAPYKKYLQCVLPIAVVLL